MNWFLNIAGWSRAFHRWQTHREITPPTKGDGRYECVMIDPPKRKLLRSKTVTMTVPIPMEAWLDLAADCIVRKLTA